MAKKHQAVVLCVLILLSVVPQPAQPGVIAGPACFITCFEFCAMMGPFKFAAFVGIVFDIAGCGAMCGVVCACSIAIPGLCFANTTTFLSESLQEVPSGEIQKGDMIYTLSPDGNKTLTRVKTALKINGAFDFVHIHLVNPGTNTSTFLTVTEEHALLVVEEDGDEPQRAIQASGVQIGHKMIGGDGQGNLEVRRVEQLTLPEKYIIHTESMTALASGILTTTSCLD